MGEASNGIINSDFWGDGGGRRRVGLKTIYSMLFACLIVVVCAIVVLEWTQLEGIDYVVPTADLKNFLREYKLLRREGEEIVVKRRYPLGDLPRGRVAWPGRQEPLLKQLGSYELLKYRNASRPTATKNAYVVSVCEDWQVVMASVLASSIRSNSPYDVIVLMGDRVTEDNIEVLAHTFDRIIYVDTLKVPVPKNMTELECRGSYEKCRCWFSKFVGFGLTDYDVIMYLDSDILMHSKCDHLFENRRYPVSYQLWGKDPTFPPARFKPKPHLSWVPHGGMYLLRPHPSRAVFVWETLRNISRLELDKHSIAKFVDQSFLYMLFPPHDKVPNGQGEHIGDWHVTHKFLSRETDVWKPAFQCGIHYPSDKPWEALSMFPRDPNHHDVFPYVDLWQKWAWKMCNSSYEVESLAGAYQWGLYSSPVIYMKNGSVLELTKNFTVHVSDVDVSYPLSRRAKSPQCKLYERLEKLRLIEYLETCILEGETTADYRTACTRFDYLVRHLTINETHPGPRNEPLQVVVERSIKNKILYDLAHPKKV